MATPRGRPRYCSKPPPIRHKTEARTSGTVHCVQTFGSRHAQSDQKQRGEPFRTAKLADNPPHGKQRGSDEGGQGWQCQGQTGPEPNNGLGTGRGGTKRSPSGSTCSVGAACVPAGREGGGGLACTSASGWLQKYLKSNLRRTAAVVDRDLKWKTKY